jgi:methyl-accepting chemotaxis protein
MAQTTDNRRRHYFIDKGFQSKYVALLVVFIISLGIAGILILVLGSDSSATAMPEGKADLNGAIIAMLMVVLVFVIFVAWYGIRFSHRVVGPVYAFNRHLNWLREGNYTRDLHLRDKDEFQNLANVFNGTQAAIRQRTREDIEVMSRVETGLSQLAEIMQRENFNSEQAANLIKRLHQELEAARVKNEGLITP